MVRERPSNSFDRSCLLRRTARHALDHPTHIGSIRNRRPRPRTVRPPWPATASLLKNPRKASGIDFTHTAPTLDPKLAHIMPQVASMGAAVSVVDFDRDGWPDIYVTNSGEGSRNALYRNLGDGTFEDVAAATGRRRPELSRGTGVSMGAVWGDYDNDGYEDLFLYRWGRPELFHNDGGKRLHARDANRPACPAGSTPTAPSGSTTTATASSTFRRRLLPEDVDLWHLEEHEDDAGELRIREERRPQIPLPQSRRRDASKRSRESSASTPAAGRSPRSPPTCAAPAIPDLFIANDYGVSELYLNDGGKAVSRGRQTRPASASRPRAA